MQSCNCWLLHVCFPSVCASDRSSPICHYYSRMGKGCQHLKHPNFYIGSITYHATSCSTSHTRYHPRYCACRDHSGQRHPPTATANSEPALTTTASTARGTTAASILQHGTTASNSREPHSSPHTRETSMPWLLCLLCLLPYPCWLCCPPSRCDAPHPAPHPMSRCSASHAPHVHADTHHPHPTAGPG